MRRSIAATIVLAGLLAAGCGSSQTHIVVGSKNFTEQVILGELLAQHLERATGLAVDRRLNLGGTLVCHQALVAGQLDVYVEYTGTALTAILKEPPSGDRAEVYAKVRDTYRTSFAAEWTEPLGFNNTFAILIRGAAAEQLGLRTLSDAAPHTAKWKAGFGYEFMERADGYPGLARKYGFQFTAAPRIMDLGLTYKALADGQVDMIAGNSTDGLIESLQLFQLEDDLEYFPPYEAAPVVRVETLRRHPKVRDALRQLGGTITEADMRRLNYEVDGKRRTVNEVVRAFLETKGLK